jgi:L-seryl-tRNA(Ser) seleniumtransferase
MKRHQLLRALRVDKMTLAAFEATLRLYISGRHKEIPVIRMIEAGKDDLLKKARALCRMLKASAAASVPDTGDFVFSIVETRDAVGGGAYPTDTLSGYGVEIRAASPVSAEALSAGLRTGRVPVIAAIRDGSVILHVRTLLPGDEKLIAASFIEAVASRHLSNCG